MDKDLNGYFSHEQLDVYRVALEFAGWVPGAAKGLPVRSSLRDQLMRASESIVLNIAEGAQQQTGQMAKKHYRVAFGSAAECAAALDLLALHGASNLHEGHQLIHRIGAMMRRLAR